MNTIRRRQAAPAIKMMRTPPRRTAPPPIRVKAAVTRTPLYVPRSGTTLLINNFYCVHSVRRAEYMAAFGHNVRNEFIKNIILLNRTGDRTYQATADRIQPGKAVTYNNYLGDADCVPSYNDFFAAAAALCRCGDPIIVANLDIYFDYTLGRLSEINLDKKFLAVSRLDAQPGNAWRSINKRGSQDAWIFTVPVVIPGSDRVYIGRRGCDNKIAWLAAEAGYTVYDPGQDIAAFHNHSSEVRFPRRKAKIPGPYLCMDRGTLIPSAEQLANNEVKAGQGDRAD